VGSPVDCDLPLTTACPSALLDRIPSVGGRVGRPRHRPGTLYADRGYDFDKYRRLIAVRGIKHRIARRGEAHGSGLGHIRYVVERTSPWLHAFRRLATCYERRADLHDALPSLGCSIICWRRLTDSCSF
jgi:transposase